jgi:carboxymethylenebutenolidase
MTQTTETEVSVDTPNGPMTTFIARPAGSGPFPVAVIFMDAAGYREALKANARRFAAGGYYCVAPDLWHHFGPGITFDLGKTEEWVTPSPGSDMERLMDMVSKLTPELVQSDTEALILKLGSDPAAFRGPMVCVGYCMGARHALHSAAALADNFVAAAHIHPGRLMTDQPDSPHLKLANVKGELYFAFAEHDHGVPPEMVDALREEMASRGIAGAVERLPDTHHGFAMADLPVYDAEAAEYHFAQTLAVWQRNLDPEVVTA